MSKISDLNTELEDYVEDAEAIKTKVETVANNKDIAISSGTDTPLSVLDKIDNATVVPSGTLDIPDNGTYNVRNYASVNVIVPNPVEYGTGKDTVKNKTPYDETDVDSQGNVIDRTNTVAGNFSATLGSRNSINSGSTETFVSGGKNQAINTEDASISGYENVVETSHQSIIGGYDNSTKASESIIVGESNTVDGIISNNNKTDTGSMAVFGSINDVKPNNKYSLIAGQDNEMKANGKWNFEVGAHHEMGQNNECVNLLGWTNKTNSYLTDSTIAGYSNTTLGGSSGNNTYSVYMFGHDNNNQNPNDVTKGLSEIYQMGHGLRAKHNAQVILGKYNLANVSETDDVLTIGCGTGDSARANCFGAGQNSSGKYIRIGSTTLLETKLSELTQNTFEVVPTEESYTIASNSWTALSSSDPYTYSATVTATYTIGNDTEVGIVPDNPVLFANYGFVVGAVSGQNVTIYALEQPSASVTLSVSYRG